MSNQQNKNKNKNNTLKATLNRLADPDVPAEEAGAILETLRENNPSVLEEVEENRMNFPEQVQTQLSPSPNSELVDPDPQMEGGRRRRRSKRHTRRHNRTKKRSRKNRRSSRSRRCFCRR